MKIFRPTKSKRPSIKFKFDRNGFRLMNKSEKKFEWLVLPGKTKKSPPRDSETYLNAVK